MSNHRALIDIDMVLDSRYGTLKLIDEQVADELVSSEAYRRRATDNFDEMTGGRIDLQEYKDLYAARTGDNLYFARHTEFVYHFAKDLRGGVAKMDRGVLTGQFMVDINIWPYDLSDQEADNVVKGLRHHFPISCETNWVNLSPETLSPQYVEKSYELLAYYNHEDWLGPNTEALLPPENRLPTTVLMTPMIASSGKIPELTKIAKDPFAARAATLVKFIALQYLQPSMVCTNPAILQQIYSSRLTELVRLGHLPPDSTVLEG